MIAWHPPSQEMPRWYRSTDLLLMTSVFEGVPYVIYESLAMGVPVVAPALPGNVEFMDEASGVLVDPRDDADRYARQSSPCSADERRRKEMGDARGSECWRTSRWPRWAAAMASSTSACWRSRSPASSRWRRRQLFGGRAEAVESRPAPRAGVDPFARARAGARPSA